VAACRRSTGDNVETTTYPSGLTIEPVEPSSTILVLFPNPWALPECEVASAGMSQDMSASLDPSEKARPTWAVTMAQESVGTWWFPKMKVPNNGWCIMNDMNGLYYNIPWMMVPLF